MLTDFRIGEGWSSSSAAGSSVSAIAKRKLGAMISQVIASLVFEQRGTGDALLLRLI